MGSIKIGRTIAERREQLENSSVRLETQRKKKKKQKIRITLVTLLYLFFCGAIVLIIFMAIKGNEVQKVEVIKVPIAPTIEIIDEDMAATGGILTNRMNEYIGLIERDFRELGYTPIKAVVPMGAIREVDFYFSDFDGYIKTTVDRGVGETVEDFGRMMKYLQGIGKMDFEYVDVRVEERGYWK